MFWTTALSFFSVGCCPTAPTDDRVQEAAAVIFLKSRWVAAGVDGGHFSMGNEACDLGAGAWEGVFPTAHGEDQSP